MSVNEENVDDRWKGDIDPLADEDERRVVYAALDSFRQYRQYAHYNVTHRRRQNLYALPSSQWQMLAGTPFNILDTLSQVDDAIDTNAEIASQILEHGLQALGIDPTSTGWHNTATANDHAKAHSTIRQFYRDWSSEGLIERDLVTAKVLQSLDAGFPFSVTPTTACTVLVPGAGLARLVFDLTLSGYDATGNEISYHQLLASNWILNHIQPGQQYDLYPFATTFTNLRSRTHQLKTVQIPDIHPATTVFDQTKVDSAVGVMNMTAGDFITTYHSPSQAHTFDAVVTVFFIDTAPNLIRYIETILSCLKPHGLWINIGPLLWHFDDHTVDHDESKHGKDKDEDKGIAEPGSFTLTDEEVIHLVQKMGFTIEKHEILDQQPLGYIQDPESMLQNVYTVSHWVARKTSQ